MSDNDPSEASSLRIRRSEERGFEDFGWADNWMTFSFSDYFDRDWINFGPLRVMIENHIQPQSGFPEHPHRNVEIVTYVVSGTLTHSDSFGHEAHINSGEMQLISAGSRGMVHSEQNIQDHVEHNYQMWLIPESEETEFDYQQLKYTPEERQDNFCLYISPDGRKNSMPINTDAFIYAGLFSKGTRIDFRVEEGRGVWIQVVEGSLEVAGVTLEQGDGLGVEEPGELEFLFIDESEILLFDLNMEANLIWR